MNQKLRIDQVLEIKGRDPRTHHELSYMVRDLGREWSEVKELDLKLSADFFVIRLVTIVEVFTRRCVRWLIDSDARFIDAALELLKQVKPEWTFFKFLQGRTLTLGDLAAHDLPVNSFSQVVAPIETLLSSKLRPLLEVQCELQPFGGETQMGLKIIEDYDQMASSLMRLFEVRHILCHELPSRRVYEKSEVDSFFSAVTAFISACEGALYLQVYGKSPAMTQVEMNAEAFDKLAEAERRMDEVIKSIQANISSKPYLKAIGGEDLSIPTSSGYIELLGKSQEAWKAFRETVCDFDSYIYQGGSIRPLIWASQAVSTTNERIEALEKWLKFDTEFEDQ